MDSLKALVKEHIAEIKTFLLLWIFVLLKFAFLKDGYTSAFFSVKMFTIVLFSASFAGVIYLAYRAFSRVITPEQAHCICAAIIFLYYCCLQSKMLYPLSAEHYIAAAFITLGCVLSFFRKSRLFSLLFCIAAVFVDPAISIIFLPIVFSQSLVLKKNDNKNEKSKKRKNRQQRTILQKSLESVAKIPAPVYSVIFALLFAASFMMFKKYNPYDVILSGNRILSELTMLPKAVLHILPAFILSAGIWICFIIINKAAVRYFCAAVPGSLICCVSGIIIPANNFFVEIYLNAALLAGLVLQIMFISEYSDVTEMFCKKYSKAVFPLLVLAAVCTGVSSNYIG